MAKHLIKGNEAIVKGAVLAGCRAFYGYPITPASEIAEAAAKWFPPVGGTFLQAESETAAINMIYGAASTGVRSMTASSGPGISLMQEGLSYLAGAELPCVIADITRGGPGLGNIAPEQSDYNQVVKVGGHGPIVHIGRKPADEAHPGGGRIDRHEARELAGGECHERALALLIQRTRSPDVPRKVAALDEVCEDGLLGDR